MSKTTKTAKTTKAAAVAAAAAEKTYTIGGTTVFEGVKTFRVANGKLNLRVNMLRFYGHEDIELFELPKPMTKVQAIAYLTDHGGITDAVVPTRASDKTAKPALQIQAEKLAATRAKRRASRAAA